MMEQHDMTKKNPPQPEDPTPLPEPDSKPKEPPDGL